MQTFYNETASFDLWNSENMKLYLGIFKDEVVSVGSLVCTKDSIGIYDIATKEKCEGKDLAPLCLITCCKKQNN